VGNVLPAELGIRGYMSFLGQICEGKGSLKDLDRLKNMSLVIKDTALCGLGQTSPNPCPVNDVKTTMMNMLHT